MKNIGVIIIIILKVSVSNSQNDFKSDFKLIDSTYFTRNIISIESSTIKLKIIDKKYLINNINLRPNELSYHYKQAWGDDPNRFTEGNSDYKYKYWLKFITGGGTSVISYAKSGGAGYWDSTSVYLCIMDKNDKITDKILIDKEFNDDKNGVKAKVNPFESKVSIAHYKSLLGNKKVGVFETQVILKEYDIKDKFILKSTITKNLIKNINEYLKYKGSSKKNPKLPEDDILK